MIYLASPYNHPDECVRALRFDLACRAAADLIRSGRIVYAPIAHCHPIILYGLPTDWSFWERADRAFMGVCEEVVVLMLDRWETSEGVQREIQIAADMRKPVRFIEATM